MPPNRAPRRLNSLFLFLALALLASVPVAVAETAKTFAIGWADGKAWLETPTGERFLSLGVCSIGEQSYGAPNKTYYDPVRNQYAGNAEAWRKETVRRLQDWGFDTIGAWSDEGLYRRGVPFTVMVYAGRGAEWSRVLEGVFEADFETRARASAESVAKWRDDTDLVGWFLDNELPWWGEFGWEAEGQRSLLERCAAADGPVSDKRALARFFSERYGGDVARFETAWGRHVTSFDDLLRPVTLAAHTKAQRADVLAWAGVVAERYFSVTTKALRAVDPRHLVLGVRFAGEAPRSVVEACGRYCDVVSVNHYSKTGDVDVAMLDAMQSACGKPLLVSEYSFSALENQSGNRNTKGADVSVPTQKERVERFARFARGLLDLPYVVGLHWFQWADESPGGRFDGEDCNYGLVDIHDRPYTALTDEHRRLNAQAAVLHAKASHAMPDAKAHLAQPDYRRAADAGHTMPVRRFLDPRTPIARWPWSDDAHGGSMSIDAQQDAVVLAFDSGTGWGAGASFRPNVPPFVASPNVADVLGSDVIVIDVEASKGLRFAVFVSESGAAAPGAASHSGARGADGETYAFPPLVGTGSRETYRVDLGELERRSSWGNQHGNLVLDLQALADVSIAVAGGQGKGAVRVYGVEFRAR